ncbi:juvenile hormone esterase-like [Culicoides brevitarsis]|uniref:juvenile hormone esterase-like n=1 Tax=Culicoides brevitarsis TaxID=469753 RepID=UPI00307C5D72
MLREKFVRFLLLTVINSVADAVLLKEFASETTDSPVVHTLSGPVRGSVLESRLGSLFFAFRGIRYAAPPVGSLRFKAPEPVPAWITEFDATEDGPRCPQPTDLDERDDVSEDCLRLNIYTAELPKKSSSVKKPVVVYLHPGGFYAVSGQSKNFAGPQSLMDRNIVLVTLNYRLGALGFLAINTPDAPGNAGLKDQVMALKWIRSNIARFGGDPNMITLLGYSAGAYSITLHLVSPMSRGLFHRAIVMSGAVTSPRPSHQLELAKRQAKLVNCPESPLEAMMTCLRVVPARLLGDTLRNMFDFLANPILLWEPVIEPNFGQERFLTHDPTELFQAGKFMKIPIISGITKDEFASPAIYILQNETLTSIMNDQWEKLAPICFLYERDTLKSLEISRELKKKYIGGTLNGLSQLKSFNELFADAVIGFPVHRFVQLASKYTKVYYYKFSYQGRYSHTYFPDDKPYGVVHHDDLLYLFVAPKIAPMFTETDPEHLIVERMTRIVANFALHGDPNSIFDPFLKEIKWKPNFGTLKHKSKYLEIDVNMTMKENLYGNRYEIWQNLFPLKQLTVQDIVAMNSSPVIAQTHVHKKRKRH